MGYSMGLYPTDPNLFKPLPKFDMYPKLKKNKQLPSGGPNVSPPQRCFESMIFRLSRLVGYGLVALKGNSQELLWPFWHMLRRWQQLSHCLETVKLEEIPDVPVWCTYICHRVENPRVWDALHGLHGCWMLRNCTYMFHSTQLYVLVLFVSCTDGVGGCMGVVACVVLAHMLHATQLHIHVSCYATVCARTVRIMHACGSLRSVLALRHTSGQDVTQEKPASKISTPL